jgi:DNA primase large subunit
VHWTKVCDLVEKRRVYLTQGQAYVPMSQQISLVIAEFTSRLDKALDVSGRVETYLPGAD